MEKTSNTNTVVICQVSTKAWLQENLDVLRNVCAEAAQMVKNTPELAAFVATDILTAERSGISFEKHCFIAGLAAHSQRKAYDVALNATKGMAKGLLDDAIWEFGAEGIDTILEYKLKIEGAMVAMWSWLQKHQEDCLLRDLTVSVVMNTEDCTLTVETEEEETSVDTIWDMIKPEEEQTQNPVGGINAILDFIFSGEHKKFMK